MLLRVGGGGRQAGQNFGGLVLGCIEAKFCNQIVFFQRFLRSTRFSILCTASNSFFFLQNFAKIDDFSRCCKILLLKSVRISYFSLKFSRNFAGIAGICWKSINNCWNFTNFLNFQGAKGRQAAKWKWLPPPLRVRQTLQKHLWNCLPASPFHGKDTWKCLDGYY